MPAPIPTSRRLEYAAGYIGLGLLKEAADELEAIEGDDRLSSPVLQMRCALYMEAKKWDMVDAMAKAVTAREPQIEAVWIHWAYAVCPRGDFWSWCPDSFNRRRRVDPLVLIPPAA